jgi:hypothetical protein
VKKSASGERRNIAWKTPVSLNRMELIILILDVDGKQNESGIDLSTLV